MTGSLIDATVEHVLERWEDLLPGVARPHRLRVLKTGGSRPAGGKITLHLLADGARLPSVIVKLPRDKAAEAAIAREAAGLARCARALSQPLRAALPLPAHLAAIQGRPAVVTAFRRGRSLRWLCPPVRKGWRGRLLAGASAAMEWLASFHRETRTGAARADNIAAPLRDPRLRERMSATGVAPLEAAIAAVAQTGEAPIAMTHGDFVPENVLWDQGGIAIVDWEWSQAEGPALADTLMFPTALALLLDPTRRATLETRVAAYRAAFFHTGWFAEAWRGLLARYCEATATETRLLPAVYPAVLASMATRDERTVGLASGTDQLFQAVLTAYLSESETNRARLWPGAAGA